MASLVTPRLASVTARDGVDTRKKDNSGMAAACTGETTRLGGGDRERVGQTAALYMAPPGAEVVGSPMHAYWSDYRRLADAYVNGEEDFFNWMSYNDQQAYNEMDIQQKCMSTTDGLYNSYAESTEGMLNIYREFYNRAITEFRRTLDSNDLEDALEYMVDFKNEQTKQETAAKTIQTWFRSFPKISETGTYIAEEEEHGECYKCGDRSMFETGLCADCYWTEDAHMKNLRRRAMRQNAIVCEH